MKLNIEYLVIYTTEIDRSRTSKIKINDDVSLEVDFKHIDDLSVKDLRGVTRSGCLLVGISEESFKENYLSFHTAISNSLTTLKGSFQSTETFKTVEDFKDDGSEQREDESNATSGEVLNNQDHHS